MESKQTTKERIDDMEARLMILEKRISYVMALQVLGIILAVAKFAWVSPITAPTTTQDIRIGEASAVNPQRDFLRADEVGEREGVSTRTVISWIETGRIDPPPIKSQRAWQIAADYRILPQTAAELAEIENKP